MVSVVLRITLYPDGKDPIAYDITTYIFDSTVDNDLIGFDLTNIYIEICKRTGLKCDTSILWSLEILKHNMKMYYMIKHSIDTEGIFIWPRIVDVTDMVAGGNFDPVKWRIENGEPPYN